MLDAGVDAGTRLITSVSLDPVSIDANPATGHDWFAPAIVGAIVTVAGSVLLFFLNRWSQRRLEELKSAMATDAADRTERLKSSLAGAVTERAEMLRSELAAGTERLKSDLAGDLFERTERLKSDLASEVAERTEHLKSQLAVLTQLSTSSQQKRAEIAAEVLVTLLRMLDALHDVTSLVAFVHEEDPPGGSPVREKAMSDVIAQAATLGPYDTEFRKAWLLAETLLPDEVTELFDRTNRLKGDILVAQYAHAKYAGTDYAVAVFGSGYGAEPRKRIAELRDNAKAILRPIAQLHVAP
jgi:hypothetical protein